MENLYIRYADKEDMLLLFEWANNTLVRKNSFSTEPITLDEHENWFYNLLLREDAKQYIYMNDKIPVGQARIVVSNNVAEIGYSIAEEHRGRGYGSRLLSALKKQVVIDFPQTNIIIGKVKDDNIASKNAFINAGYECEYTLFTYKV